MNVKHIVVHCSDTYANQDIGAAEIDKWHRVRGWSRIGYNYVIRRDGRLESGREEGAELAHAAGYNKEAIAICLVGGKGAGGDPAPNYEPAQMASLATALGWFRLKYPQAEICGHRDLPGVAKDCPSFNVRHWLATRESIEPRKKTA